MIGPVTLGSENAVEQYAYTLGLIEKSSGLPKSTVKASLASKLAIDSVFHDAGRGPETYCVPGYNMVNNIAQYIDPATDMHFDEVYPPRNSTIFLPIVLCIYLVLEALLGLQEAKLMGLNHQLKRQQLV